MLQINCIGVSLELDLGWSNVRRLLTELGQIHNLQTLHIVITLRQCYSAIFLLWKADIPLLWMG